MDLKNNKAILNAIKFINNATPSTTETEWMNIIRNFGNNSIIQELAIKSPYIPDKCIEYLIYEKKLQSSLCLRALSKDYLSEATVKLSIASSVSLWDLKNHINQCYDAKIKIPDKNLIWLYSLPHDDIKFSCLKSISDENFIKKEIDNGLSERYLTAVASNYSINECLRQEIFDSGIDFLYLENPTQEMADEICVSLMASVFDNIIDKNDPAMQMVLSTCLEKLTKLIRQNICSEDIQLELLKKCEDVCKKGKNDGIEDLYITLIQNTTKPQVLAYGYDSCIQNVKHYAVCNSHMDKGLSSAIADTILSDISKKSGFDYTSDMAILSMIIKRAPLSYWAYDNINRNNYTQLLVEVAKSKHTDSLQLKELMQHKNQKIARIAEFHNRVFKSGSLYEDEYKKALNAFEPNGINDSDNILVLRLPQLLDEIKAVLTDIANKTTAQPMKDAIQRYVETMVNKSEFEIAKKYCGLFEYSKDLNCMILEYEKIPNLTSKYIKECLEKLNNNHLGQLIKEIEFEYFVANSVHQHQMFEGKEIMLKKINEIIDKREKEIPEKEVRENDIEI